jgi:DNA-binding NarL/FixJ family response regulator
VEKNLPTIFVTGDSRLSIDMLAAALSGSYAVFKTLPEDAELVAAIDIVAGCVTAFDVAAALVRRAKRILPNAKVVLAGGQFSEEEFLSLIEMGASGCVPDDGSLASLLATVDAVRSGQTFCSERIAALVFARLAMLAKLKTVDQPPALTSRESEIFQLVRQGLSNKEIAHALSISLSTVKNHVHRILEKLQLRRRRDAIDWDSRLQAPMKRGKGQRPALPGIPPRAPGEREDSPARASDS